jgi:hypothetical protein
MGFEAQAHLINTPHPLLDLLSTSKLPCPGVMTREDEPDVVGIGAEKRLKITFSKVAQTTTEHEAHCPPVQRGEQAEESDQRCDEDVSVALSVASFWHGCLSFRGLTKVLRILIVLQSNGGDLLLRRRSYVT